VAPFPADVPRGTVECGGVAGVEFAGGVEDGFGVCVGGGEAGAAEDAHDVDVCFDIELGFGFPATQQSIRSSQRVNAETCQSFSDTGDFFESLPNQIDVPLAVPDFPRISIVGFQHEAGRILELLCVLIPVNVERLSSVPIAEEIAEALHLEPVYSLPEGAAVIGGVDQCEKLL